MPVMEDILRQAREAGASDVHLTVGSPPKMRINGSLVTMNFSKMLSADTMDMLIDVMPETLRQSFEESGECVFSFSVSDCGRFRVSAYKQQGCVAMAIRIVGVEVPGPEELGLPEPVAGLCRKTGGLILVAGPMGCGKSSTLASIIDGINSSREAHIITLENPIEYQYQYKMSTVDQREIGVDCESYEDAMRAALKEDPDVILLGELNDPDTIATAFNAAETGCLVLSAVNTKGVAEAIEHLVNFFPPYYQQRARAQLANVLTAAVFQQLIPRSDGSGRVAAFEVLLANQAVRNMIREGKTGQLSGVMQAGRKLGMITMDEAILLLYREGKIGRESVVRYVQDPEAMALKLAASNSRSKA